MRSAIDPKAVGAVLLVLGSWAEARHHTDTQNEVRDDSRRALWRHTLELERRADSLSVRTRYLERQVARFKRSQSSAETEAEPPFGPVYEGPPRGTLGKSLGGALGFLFAWARTDR
jgi:hypothetical protein